MKINDAIFTSNLEIRPEIKGFRKLQKMSKIKRGGRAQGGLSRKLRILWNLQKLQQFSKEFVRFQNLSHSVTKTFATVVNFETAFNPGQPEGA